MVMAVHQLGNRGFLFDRYLLGVPVDGSFPNAAGIDRGFKPEEVPETVREMAGNFRFDRIIDDCLGFPIGKTEL